MNDLDVLTGIRHDTPAISARARHQGRNRLLDEIGGSRPRASRWRLARRPMLLTGAAAAITAVLVAFQVAGTPAKNSTAEAATVLTLAASAVTITPAIAPRSDQFIYLDVVHVTGGMTQHVQTWTSVDGSRPGLIRSAGFLGNSSTVSPRPDPAHGLRQAPYAVVAELPTDPQALLRALYADPYVEEQMQHNGISREVAVWSMLRDLVETAPGAQKAAMFKAAALIPGITHVEHATDAAGRSGEAVGLEDPRLGSIQFIFDTHTHAFLGERVMDPGSTTSVQFNDAVQHTGVADKPGVVPNN